MAERETVFVVTSESIDRYIQSLQERGRTAETVQNYRRSLAKLYKGPPEDKVIRADTLLSWRERLLAKGYSSRTVNTCLSAANSYVGFCGYRQFQVEGQLEPGHEEQPRLTRREYLRMLSTARSLGKERAYLLIKLFATTGVTVQELHKVTVEGVLSGRIQVKPRESRQEIFLYDGLRDELLGYARRCGVRDGPVFVTRNGKPLLRSNVTDSIRRLCQDAWVEPEKGNPRCLHKLYLETRRTIIGRLEEQARETYESLLDREQLAVGWEE